jgi:hypothetical protein
VRPGSPRRTGQHAGTSPQRWSRLLLAVFVATAFALWLWAVPAAAQTPTPTASSATLVPGGDTRSEPEGPGLVGEPIVVALGVLALGATAAAFTLLYLRLSRDE